MTGHVALEEVNSFFARKGITIAARIPTGNLFLWRLGWFVRLGPTSSRLQALSLPIEDFCEILRGPVWSEDNLRWKL